MYYRNYFLKRLTLYFSLTFYLISCKQKTEKPYIFSVEKAELISKIKNNGRIVDLNLIPPPPTQPYSAFNFVINKNELYFFSLPFNYELICGTGIDDSQTPFINLKPSQLIKIPNEFINSFLQNNISDKKEYSFHFTVSSTSDTLNSEIYDIFTNFKSKSKRESNLNISINLIKSTEEIDTVLHYCEHGKSYFPKRIKWRTKFQNYSRN